MITILNPEVLDDYAERYSNLSVSHFENGFAFNWLVDGDTFFEKFVFYAANPKKNLNVELTSNSIGRLLPPSYGTSGFDLITPTDADSAIDQIRWNNNLNMSHRYDRVSNHLVIITITFT